MKAKREKGQQYEEKFVFIREDGSSGDDNELSLIDIKAAVAKQGIPISELYSNQDLASNRNVIGLIHDAESKIRSTLEKENVILRSKNTKLQAYRDKAETTTLVDGSKELADKNPQIVNYIKARLSTGRGVDLSGDLTDDQRQEKVNAAVVEELELIDKQGIIFKEKAGEDKSEVDPDVFKDGKGDEDVDMMDPDNNPLIVGANKDS